MQDPGAAGPRRSTPPGRWKRRPPQPPARRGRPGPVARALARVVVRVADATSALLRAGPAAGRERISEADLRDLVAANTVLDRDERRIIAEVLAAGSRLIREVMVPRPDVTFLAAGLSLEHAADLARAHWHTRFPVVDGTTDDVIGLVWLRDLLHRPPNDRRTTVADVTREIKRLPGSKRVLAALSEMRREGQHLALVVDEYGGTAGIVTLEDLVEELVGEVRDGARPPEPPPGPSHPAELDGRLNRTDFAEQTGLSLPDGPYETVGGFVMAALGRLPVAGDEVPVPGGEPMGWVLRVLELDGRRIARVALHPSVTVAVPAQPSRAARSADLELAPGGAVGGRGEPARVPAEQLVRQVAGPGAGEPADAG